jgi:hypothetical protein
MAAAAWRHQWLWQRQHANKQQLAAWRWRRRQSETQQRYQQRSNACRETGASAA